MGSDHRRRDPLVSIVTPTLNRADLLEHTLRSVRNQTYRNVEHIVIDGGSVDATLDLLRRYETMYRLRWTSGPDAGMYNAINAGLQQANGEVLAYINSDDLYFPWAIEAVVRRFDQRPDADFVFGDVIAVDDRSGRQALNFQPPFNADYVRRCGFLCQPTVFWRRSVLEDEGAFDESLKYVADCDYWMRVAPRRTFVKVNEFLALERNHGRTLRQTDSSALMEELGAVRSRYVRLDGFRHDIALLWHRLRAGIWVRGYWAAFAIQSMLPRRRRIGPWSRLLDSGQPRIRWHLLPLKFVPGMSTRRPRVVQPSRYWLEPPE